MPTAHEQELQTTVEHPEVQQVPIPRGLSIERRRRPTKTEQEEKEEEEDQANAELRNLLFGLKMMTRDFEGKRKVEEICRDIEKRDGEERSARNKMTQLKKTV